MSDCPYLEVRRWRRGVMQQAYLLNSYADIENASDSAHIFVPNVAHEQPNQYSQSKWLKTEC